MTAIIIILVLIGLPVVFAIFIYNKFIRLRNMVEEGWSGIEVQLKRRANLIPNLLETVKGYMGHERELLSKVTELRSRSMQEREVGEKARLEDKLSHSLANVFAVAEGYPDLKANQNFLELQAEFSEIEDQIQLARRYYNGTVRNLNIQVELSLAAKSPTISKTAPMARKPISGAKTSSSNPVPTHTRSLTKPTGSWDFSKILMSSTGMLPATAGALPSIMLQRW